MVKQLFVTGLNVDTALETVKSYFETFGPLYECNLPAPSRSVAFDFGPDNENFESRSSIQYKKVKSDEIIDDDLDVEKYDETKHGNFEDYMRKIGQGEAWVERKKAVCAGYGYVTFVDRESYERCMRHESHVIDNAKCSVELLKEFSEKLPPNLKSKRLYVSFWPLEKLSAQELRTSFGGFGKITDVEFVNDSEGPLHFCIITFTEPEAVDRCVAQSSSFVVRNVNLLVRRAVLRETIKMAEQKEREEANQKTITLPPNHHAFYPKKPRNPPPPPQDPTSAYGYGPRHW